MTSHSALVLLSYRSIVSAAYDNIADNLKEAGVLRNSLSGVEPVRDFQRDAFVAKERAVRPRSRPGRRPSQASGARKDRRQAFISAGPGIEMNSRRQ
jgi:hypothetical protein